MRLSISKSKNSTSLYVIKSTYENGIRSSKIVEKLGTVKELKEKLNGQDPIEWAKRYIDELNEKEKEDKREVIVKYSPVKTIDKDVQRSFNGGYLFIQQIYYTLGLHKICEKISNKYKFTFDLNSVLSRLVYGRILFPASKLATSQLSENFIEQPNFELQHIYRGLEVIAKEVDFIQSELYKNSLKVSKRNTGILYYDCTNYFFEIEEEDGLKQYGLAKDHKPNPIVQMGLFMDGDGVPLAFSINKGNTNEQITLTPLEQQILTDFDLSKFVVCTDGEIAKKEVLSIDTKLIATEESFDGFYGVCTNLEDGASEIIKVNKRRWEIEECFRIMKSEFKARPVFLSRDDRIIAHFMTCFISLIIYRLLEKKLGEKYTCNEILTKLKDMNFYEIKGEGYIPTYTRDDLTDDLHEAFGFRTDYQIVSKKQMKNIFKVTKQ